MDKNQKPSNVIIRARERKEAEYKERSEFKCIDCKFSRWLKWHRGLCNPSSNTSSFDNWFSMHIRDYRNIEVDGIGVCVADETLMGITREDSSASVGGCDRYVEVDHG